MSARPKVKHEPRRSKREVHPRWWQAGVGAVVLAVVINIPWEQIAITINISR